MRIKSEKKTTLLSLRNKDAKTVKVETKRINKLFTPTNNITELNELIYARVKLVRNENRCSPKEHK